MLYYFQKKIKDFKIINGIFINLFTAIYRLYRVLYRYFKNNLFDLASIIDNVEYSDFNDDFKS